MFGYAFSAIANFGILTRERVQVLPFLFVPAVDAQVAQAGAPSTAAASGRAGA